MAPESLLLGVPTLCRYDLLEQLIDSAERGSLKPRGYVIVDNGGKCPLEGPNITCIAPGRNVGVAAAWNLLLDHAGEEALVISNDDIVFGPRTFEELVTGVARHPFVSGLGFALFAQSPECVKRVGFYDENFWPAYYEDDDYAHRLRRAGIEPLSVLSEPVQHLGWATTRALGDRASYIHEQREVNARYFEAKWGSSGAHYAEPFDGKPPQGWAERHAGSADKLSSTAAHSNSIQRASRSSQP